MSITSAFTSALRPLALAASMTLAAMGLAFAQGEEPGDPPGRVGRISLLEGTVSFRNAEGDQWVPATRNFPVTTGDSVWTEPNARAEIQIGSTDLRLGATTALSVARLDDAATEIQLDQGSINLRLRDLPPGGVRLLTPRAAIDILQPGRYHVDVAQSDPPSPDDHVRLAVFEGAARIEGNGPGLPLTVSAGHSATLRGDGYPLLAQAATGPLDSWALERERLLNPQESARYVSPEMTGHQDLGRYGTWGSDPNYGTIWYPSTTAVDWAPYRYGHWAYVAPWGWTWIDDEPWGFAPFHYGRWVRVGPRWAWCPGHRAHRPVYAPALVVFVSGGNVVVHSGRRAPALGWVPLAPHEAYRPYHRHSPAYARNVNITNVNVTNVTVINKDRDRDSGSVRGYRNRDAMTVVSSESFTAAAPVSKTRVRDGEADAARRIDSLDHLRPSRAAKAGVATPVAAVAEPRAPEPRQRSFRRDGDDDRMAPPAVRAPRPAPAVLAGDPDVVPKAPGPRRESRSADRARDGAQQAAREPADGQPAQSREPAASPLQRPGSAPSAVRPAEPQARAPMPPGRVANPAARDGGPAATPDARLAPDAPRALTPSQQPGTAPNTIAPARPAPIDREARPDPTRERPAPPQVNREAGARPDSTPPRPALLAPSPSIDRDTGARPDPARGSRPSPSLNRDSAPRPDPTSARQAPGAVPSPSINQATGAPLDLGRERGDRGLRDADRAPRMEPSREPPRSAPSRPESASAPAPRALPPGREAPAQASPRPPGRPAETAPPPRVTPPPNQPRRDERSGGSSSLRDSPAMRPPPAPQPVMQPRPEPRMESRQQPTAQPRPEPRMESRPAPQPRPKPRMESRPQPAAQPRPEPRMESRPQPAAQPRPQESQRPSKGGGQLDDKRRG